MFSATYRLISSVPLGEPCRVGRAPVPSAAHSVMVCGPIAELRCRLCGRVFRAPSTFRHHMSLHRGETTCTVCHKVYSHKGNLKNHMMAVHGVSLDDGRRGVGAMLAAAEPRSAGGVQTAVGRGQSGAATAAELRAPNTFVSGGAPRQNSGAVTEVGREGYPVREEPRWPGGSPVARPR